MWTWRIVWVGVEYWDARLWICRKEGGGGNALRDGSDGGVGG